MANEFDSEMEQLRTASLTSSLAEASAADQQLSSLQNEIDQAKYAKQARVECARDGDALKVQIKGQAVAFWRVEGAQLALYRSGSDLPETHASDPGQAAIFTARLIAAAGQI